MDHAHRPAGQKMPLFMFFNKNKENEPMQGWRPNEFTLQTTLNQNPCGNLWQRENRATNPLESFNKFRYR